MLWCPILDLALQISLHLLNLLHLVGQLIKAALAVGLGGVVDYQHLLLLLKQHHLLLHHVHLHLDGLRVNCWACVSGDWRLCYVHHRRLEIVPLSELSEERVIMLNVADIMRLWRRNSDPVCVLRGQCSTDRVGAIGYFFTTRRKVLVLRSHVLAAHAGFVTLRLLAVASLVLGVDYILLLELHVFARR